LSFQQKTKAQKATFDPIFNETFDFRLDDIGEKRLHVSLWSHDMLGKNPFFGEVPLRLSDLPVNDLVNKWYPLESMSYGEVNCRLSYDQTNDYLNVLIIKARNLEPTRQNALPDPYVKVYLLPDRKKQTKKKTQCKKATLHPEYNETVSYFLTEVDNAKARTIQVAVVDHGSVGGNEVVGSFSITVNEVIEAQVIESWFPLIKDKGAAEK